MKVGNIAEPNEKGQIVIPKKMREALGITQDTPLNIVVRGEGLYLYPIEEVILKGEKENSYFRLLEKTRGSWQAEKWQKRRALREKIELEASRKRRLKW